MRKILVVAILLAGLVAVDAGARSYAQSSVASAVKARVRGVSDVEAHIDSFPFLGRLLLQGKVSELDVTFTNVTGHGIDVAGLRIEATGIELDRSVLVGKRHVRIRDVDTVSARATITEDEVRRVTNADVRLSDGEATVNAAGVTATATVDVVDGQVRLHVSKLPVFTIPVPDSELLPCAVQAKIVERALELSCTSHTLPAIVVDAIGAADLQQPAK